MTAWDRRQLVSARNTLMRAARQIDIALDHPDRCGFEFAYRVAYAYAVAGDAMTDLRRATTRLNRRRKHDE